MTTKRTHYTDLIKQVCPSRNLDPDLVEAVVVQESGGNAHAYRFEPKFWSRYLSKKSDYVGKVPQRVSASYGLMQLMYPTVVDMGFKGEPEELFLPVVNLLWGTTRLADLLEWAKGDIISALAAYNGGKADNEPGHQPRRRNEVYALSVLRLKEGFNGR